MHTINRRNFIRLTGLASSNLLITSKLKAKKSDKINLLFIMTDQQRWDALSVAGNKVLKTPNIDKLAEKGAYFENAYSSCPVCGPARAVILTGNSIYTTKVPNNKGMLNNKNAPMPSFDNILAENDYHTEYYGKWHTPYHLTRTYKNKVKATGKLAKSNNAPSKTNAFREHINKHCPNKRGKALKDGERMDKMSKRPYKMDKFDWMYGMSPAEQEKILRKKDKHYTGQPGYFGKFYFSDECSQTACTFQEAIEALEKIKDKPFSLTSSLSPPHPPYLVTESYYNLYKPKTIPVPKSINDSMKNNPYKKKASSKEQKRYREPERVQHMRSIYYGMVKEIDDWVGRLLKKLKDLGLEKNTLVIFTSDHGEMLGDHGMHSKMIFLEGSAHIPLIISFPSKIKSKTVISDPVSHIDLYATILDYMGVKAGESEGRSLRNIIEGKGNDGIDYCISQWHASSTPAYMIRTKEWKYMCGREARSSFVDALYNMKEDPEEMNNLIGKNRQKRKYEKKAEEMKEKLLDWMIETRSPHVKGVKSRRI